MIKKLIAVMSLALMVVVLCACGQSPEEQYALIKEELKTTESLQSSFFADYYDTKDLEKAKADAEKAIEESNEDVYKEVLTELQAQNEAFLSFIESEKEKSFSIETGDGDYPFAIDESSIEYYICMIPYEKHSSEYPVDVCFFEADTTDELPLFDFNVKNGICIYSYELQNIDTKWIDVQDGNGEVQKAFVNTEMVFYPAPDSWEPDNELYPLETGSVYLFNTEEYGLTVAIKDKAKVDEYILFHF